MVATVADVAGAKPRVTSWHSRAPQVLQASTRHSRSAASSTVRFTSNGAMNEPPLAGEWIVIDGGDTSPGTGTATEKSWVSVAPEPSVTVRTTGWLPDSPAG